ncbi:hypothetical protein IIA28_13900 [candidate division KSB1 bacterium]|nr:hypothetical protein [candidate division KSB1 bacterium]
MNFLKTKHLMILMILLFSSTILLSQESTNSNYPIDPELGFSTGPAIGAKVPDFRLLDQFGELRSLKDLLGKNGAVLNLYRSADW